jgi:hypothetical protein
MNSRTLMVSLVLAFASPVATSVWAADTSPVPNADQQQLTAGYLGVLLVPVSGELRAQLGNVLPSGEGVMIREVVNGSPAAKAGLKAYDILTGFNDQKLFSVGQVTHLVRAESPNTTVTLHVLREGAKQDIPVTLGETEAMAEGPGPEVGMPMYRHPPTPYEMLPKANISNWDSFDSMNLTKLPDGTFKASIQYFGKDGNLIKQEFAGTRDSIRKQIFEQKELPAAERHQLLLALSARDTFLMPSPPEWVAPDYFPPQWFSWPPFGFYPPAW